MPDINTVVVCASPIYSRGWVLVMGYRGDFLHKQFTDDPAVVEEFFGGLVDEAGIFGVEVVDPTSLEDFCSMERSKQIDITIEMLEKLRDGEPLWPRVVEVGKNPDERVIALSTWRSKRHRSEQ